MELAPTHFGLTIEPPAVPPGGTVLLRYRTVNHAAVPAPPATVEFLIDPAAVVELPDIGELGQLAPGASGEVCACVRLRTEVRNGASVYVQAALTAGDEPPVGSNIGILQVCGAAVLAAEPTRLVLSPTSAAGCTLDATIANTGNAPSAETRLVVDLPAGIAAAGCAQRIDRVVPPLEPGTSATLTFALSLDGIAALPLQIVDAALLSADGRRVALAPSEPVLPALEAPALKLTLERSGRRIDARLTIENPNVCALTELVLDAAWPRTLRLAEGSVLVDGRAPLRAGARAAAATLKAAAGGATIALAHIAPRATTEIGFSGYTSATAAGDVAVVLRTNGIECRAEAGLPPGRACGPTLRLAAGAPAAVAGSEARARAIVIGGDEPCVLAMTSDDPALRLFVDGAPLAADAVVALAAGTRRELEVVVPVDAACADGAQIERRVRATSDRGDITELCVAFTVRSRAWLEIADWLLPADEGARLAVTNAGSTPATGVCLDAADGSHLALGTIPPGETVTRTIDARGAAAFAAGARLLHAGSIDPLVIAPLHRPSDSAATVAFELPREVHEGIAFDARWTLTIPAGAHTLVVRCAEDASLAVVPGTTTIDDHAIVDDFTPRLAVGITLHAVPAGSRIDFAARCIARAPGTIAFAIVTAIDGGEERSASQHVHATPRAAFPQKPAGMRFYLDAPAIDAAAIDAAAMDKSRVDSAVIDAPREPDLVDEARRASLLRALRRAGDDAIADALGVLAALMPADVARDEFAENAERLSVKLRIPGYLAEADDYESVAARDALDRARGEAGREPLAAPRGSVAALAAWCARIDANVAPELPVSPYVRAFVQFADERGPAQRAALEAARDALRAALAVAA